MKDGDEEDEKNEKEDASAGSLPSETEAKQALKRIYSEIKDSKKAVLINRQLQVIKTVATTSIVHALERSEEPVFAAIVDGSATSGIIRSCEDAGISYLGARNFSSVEGTRVNLVSL